MAWRAHPRFPLIVLSNRDEVHDRPAVAASWWADDSSVVGGRDLVGGGSWHAMSHQGRVAVVMNYPGRSIPPGTRISRGRLVRDWLTTGAAAEPFLEAVRKTETAYSGFCLIIGDPNGWHRLVSPSIVDRRHHSFGPGVFGVSNSPPEAPWPKVRFLEGALSESIRAEQLGEDHLFGLLGTRSAVLIGDPASAGAGPAVARTPFVVGRRYGTRASTVTTIDARGECRFSERRFDAEGRLTGESLFTFDIGDAQ